jgi:hypothetical protein
MPITFSAADRKAITRRQVNILAENNAFDQTTTALAAQKAKLLEVDNSNSIFYDFYDTQARAYEDEARYMDGQVSSEYTPTNLDDAGQFGVGGPFFPNTTPNVYIRSIPLIQDGLNTNNKVRGRFHTTSTDSAYELNILSNTDSSFIGLEQLVNFLATGVTGATPAVSNITSFSGDQLVVTSTTNFLAGEYIYVGTSGSSGIYKILSVDNATYMTVEDVVPAAVQPTSGTADNTVVGFNATERQTLVSTTWQEILTNLASYIASRVSSWEGKVDSQVISLGIQNDDRTTQATENAAALADVTNTKSVIDTWQALSNTGVGGKYTSAGLSPVSTEVNARQSFIPTRITQIETALGDNSSDALSQSGDTFTAVDLTNSYYRRYVWINIRINRTSGSLRRFYASDQSSSKVAELKADNLAVKAQYDSYFTTVSVEFVDGSDIIYVTTTSGFSVSDSVKVLSETQAELPATVEDILDVKTLRLSMPVPVTYQASDVMRMFKQL